MVAYEAVPNSALKRTAYQPSFGSRIRASGLRLALRYASMVST